MDVSGESRKRFGIYFLGNNQIRQEFRKIYEDFICINENNKSLDTQLNPKEFRIFCHLLRSTNRGKRGCNERLDTIGKICGMNKDTVGNWIKKLAKKKFITIEVTRKRLEQSGSCQIHTRRINQSFEGINSLDQVYIDQSLDDYGFHHNEFRVYFHILFKHEFSDTQKEEKKVIASSYESSFSSPMVEVNIIQDSKKLKIAERTLQKALQSLEKKKVIVADSKKYISGTNQAISYEIRGINDLDMAKATQQDELSSNDFQNTETIKEQQLEEANLDDILF